MNHAEFQNLVVNHGFPAAVIYEDLSESGAVLWHDESIAAQLMLRSGVVTLRVVVKLQDSEYAIYESEDFNWEELTRYVDEVRKGADSIRLCARGGKAFRIYANGSELHFKLT